MDAALYLLGKLNTPKWNILASFVAVYSDSKFRKVREKPPDNVENRIMGCGGRENSLYFLRIRRKREGESHLVIAELRRPEGPPSGAPYSYRK